MQASAASYGIVPERANDVYDPHAGTLRDTAIRAEQNESTILGIESKRRKLSPVGV